MIEINNVSKTFDDIKAVSDISLQIKEGSVFGLIGTNGAGKSTLLRMMAGIYKPDEGEIKIDGSSVFENDTVKKNFFYISDEQFFFHSSTPSDMCKFYSGIYDNYNSERFNNLISKFDLDKNRKISTFSKGMKKQLSIILGLCSNTKYLLLDETFDGLDPVMRQGTKSLFASEMEERDFTPIIASHNLRELEDICDYIGLLHKGGVILSKELEEMKANIRKIQCVLKEDTGVETFKEFDILNIEKRGSLYTITIRGEEKEILEKIVALNPLFAEALPLTLEEIFISETGGVGYDIKKILF